MYNYCKTCCHDDGDIGFCDKCYYNHILEEKGIPPTKYEAKPKPITNADRLRAMTDEELVEMFDLLTRTKPESKNDKQLWLDWLKQEVSTDG